MTLCSEVFFQLYALHAQIHDRVLPRVYALLPTEIELLYNRLLLQIREIVPNFPTDIPMDFERASVNSFRWIYPIADIKTCFYYFCSSI